MPDSVNKGTNPAMMIAAAKNIEVVLEATHEEVLKLVPLRALKRHALDLH